MNFRMVGKLSIGKETEKFKPFTEQLYEKSGWIKKRLNFNVTSGVNRFTLTLDDGTFQNGNGVVRTFTKSYFKENGEQVKGELVSIPWKERMKQEWIDQIADFRKYVFDTEVRGRRQLIAAAVEKKQQGQTITDEEYAKMGLEVGADLEEALAKSNAKHKEFLTAYDYIDYVKKVIESGKYANSNFYIKGTSECQYNPDGKTKIWENYVPQRIYLADPKEPVNAEAEFKFLFGKDAIDDGSREQDKKIYIKGWRMEYNQNYSQKNNPNAPKLIPIPTVLVTPAADANATEMAKKLERAVLHKFEADDDKIYEYGVIVKMIDGAQQIELTEDMLTDEQKEDLECGLITLDDIRKEIGGNPFGARIRELRFVKPMLGYSKGKVDTIYTPDDMEIKAPEVPAEDDALPFDDDEI